jgi:heme/copper-type cytochrome/quinol oxidase subunit 4
MSDESDSGKSPYGGLWLAGLLFVFLTLAVWVFFYARFGERGRLDTSETSVVALVIALVVFGGRWCVMHFRRKPDSASKEAHK